MAMNLVAELTHLKSREHLSYTLIYDPLDQVMRELATESLSRFDSLLLTI